VIVHFQLLKLVSHHHHAYNAVCVTKLLTNEN